MFASRRLAVFRNPTTEPLKGSVTHWASLNQIARLKLPPGDETRQHLQSNAISQEGSNLLLMLNPIAHALNRAQRESCTLAEAVEIWVELLRTFPPKSGGYHFVLQRSKSAMECPFFLLANVLDYRFHGKNLTTAQIALARDYAASLGTEVGSAFTLYLARANPFSEALFTQSSDPVSWWQAGLRSGFPSALTSVAIRLCCCLASSANIERNFSIMGVIPQSIRYPRNRVKGGIKKNMIEVCCRMCTASAELIFPQQKPTN